MLKTLLGAVVRGLMVVVVICAPYGAYFGLEDLMGRFPSFFATELGGSIVFVSIVVILFALTPASVVVLISLAAGNHGGEFGTMGP